jgi:hypothetical protein
MNEPNFRPQLRCPQQPAQALISSGGQSAQGQPSATIKRKGLPRKGWPFAFDHASHEGIEPAGHGASPGFRRALLAAGRARRACRPVAGRSRRLHHLPWARIVSGPFSSCVSPGKRADVLRVARGRSTRNRPLLASTPSLFSVWPAGRRSGWLFKFNHLRARVRCQPKATDLAFHLSPSDPVST